jgi:[acyl-carrier-protein] S-malonyltransferase
MKTAYVFPGQGSQYEGMGKDLYENFASSRAIFDRADAVLGFPLSQMCFEGPEDDLTLTVNAQPALLTVSMACLVAVQEAIPELLPEPAFMAGHSLGEYSALTASGSLDFEMAVSLARERGRLMYEAGLENPGAMAAIIGMSVDAITKICKETGVFIANLNCPGQIVISGPTVSIKAATSMAKEQGAKLAVRLQVSGAFHSPLMRPAAEELKSKVQDVPIIKTAIEFTDAVKKHIPTVNLEFSRSIAVEKSKQDNHTNQIKGAIKSAMISEPKIPVIGNTKAEPLKSAEEVRDELMEQVCNCVQWEKSIEYMISQGVDTFIEIGPGNVLSGLIGRINKNITTLNMGCIEDIKKLEKAFLRS